MVGGGRGDKRVHNPGGRRLGGGLWQKGLVGQHWELSPAEEEEKLKKIQVWKYDLRGKIVKMLI